MADETDGADNAEAKTEEKSGASRRGFLKGAGIAGGGVLAGGLAGITIGEVSGAARVRDEFAPLDARKEPGFDHLVVVMFENRSFDNILGYLYSKQDLPEGETFAGLNFGDHTNSTTTGDTVAAHVYEGETDVVMGQPSPDPGEEFPHVNTQLFGTIDPPDNAGVSAEAMDAPFNAPPAGTKAQMGGFLDDYIVNYRRLKKGVEPTRDEYETIMGNFSPEMLPVFSTLAREFAVYDNWFCAVPSQTFCNRSFFHASTSHGFVTNKGGGGYNKWLADDLNNAPTLFNRLEEQGLDWRVYFDELQLVSYTGMLHAPVLEPYWKTNFATMEQFYDDVRSGNLPEYSFIEPRLVYNHNDMHPPTGHVRESEVEGTLILDGAVSDVRAGELLLHEIYSAIRESATEKGSNAMNTMLFITFDEHGGLYDHVVPPSTTPPDDSGAGEMGFEFDRLGCRVPAIAVSAYTKAGTILHEEMHHGSVIKTMSRRHGLAALTKRDESANDMFGVINLDVPRQSNDWPTTTPQYLPPNAEVVPPHPAHANKDKPLSPPATGLMGLLLARYGDAQETIPTTFEGAYNALKEHGESLFSSRDETEPEETE
ncbi:twin-arginine translocation signal domain-containing protein [Microbacteriaceae bacterium VKM Ac-2855]|nr:twin-arginine translocation signal domain-containing protein [Microbacteriaceae bacterium VKM Ac-2855]